MTQQTGTWDSYDVTGNREDLADIIYDISPTETPFMNSIGRSKAENVLHEWQTDALDAVDGSNAQVEGDEASGNTLTATTRANNRTQISDKVAIVTGTQRAINAAGRSDELEYQVAKVSKELKRDMETILLSNQAPVTGDSSTARKLRGLPSWYTNASAGAGGSNGSTSAGRTDGTQRAFTEALLNTVIEDVWDDGGDPDMIMVGGFNKRAMTDFVGAATEKSSSVESKKVISSVDIYISDFGHELKVVPNRFQRSREAHVIQSDMFAVSFLQPFNIIELAKDGNFDKRQVLAEYTLEARNEASSGIVADLTTS